MNIGRRAVVPKYDVDAIRTLADTVGKKAGHYGQVGDALPRVDDHKAFGALQNSDQVVSRVHGALSGFTDQFSAAEKHLKLVSSALSSAADLVEAQERENAKALPPPNERA
jgi:hypothetical protein